MKKYVAMALVLAVLLVGCAGTAQPESEGEALEITSFSFRRTASYADGCYRFCVAREEGGVRLYAEELFLGGRVADTMIGEEILKRLGELAGTYHVDRWDGFDKSKSAVNDGSSFTLEITLADGSTISAHGNNSFPEYYPEFSAAVEQLHSELMEQYGVQEAEGGHEA